MHPFAYRGQTSAGQPVSGTVDAADHDAAMRQLADLGVKVKDLESLRATAASPRGAVGAGEFRAFNEQLAHLTRAGLPVERGLRLIAEESRSRRFAAAVRAVADEVARGTPLGDAFRRSRSGFPPLYGRLVDAGVESRNLPAMLFNLNRHVDLVQRLRASITQAVAYPFVVAVALAGVLLFLSVAVIPEFYGIFADFDVELPWITELVLSFTIWGPAVFGGLLVVLLMLPVLWRVLRGTGRDAMVAEAFGLPLPLVGPVLQKGLVARWCDATRVGVESALDLPGAMELASEAIASPGLREDTRKLIDAMERGQRLAGVGALRVLPRSVPTAMDLGIEQVTLPTTLETLATMYREQAESRVSAVQVLLTPILLLAIAVVVGTVVIGLFLPMLKLMQAVM